MWHDIYPPQSHAVPTHQHSGPLRPGPTHQGKTLSGHRDVSSMEDILVSYHGIDASTALLPDRPANVVRMTGQVGHVPSFFVPRRQVLAVEFPRCRLMENGTVSFMKRSARG